MAHGRVAGVHGTAVWGAAVVGHRSSVMRLGPAGMHARGRVTRQGSGSRTLALTLSLGGGGGSGGGCSLLLHLLPGLHLGVPQLLHVKGLTLRQQLLPLKLQLQSRRQDRVTDGWDKRRCGEEPAGFPFILTEGEWGYRVCRGERSGAEKQLQLSADMPSVLALLCGSLSLLSRLQGLCKSLFFMHYLQL